MRANSPSSREASANGGGDSAARAAKFSEHARRYSKLGWALVRLEGKEGRGKGWQRTQPDNDPELAAGKWRTWGEKYNLGILAGPSGLAIIDTDGADGEAELDGALAGATLPDAPTVLTRRGRHIYYADPTGELKLVNGKSGQLELRAGEHLVAAPPSIHPKNGADYAWITKPPWELAPPPLPERLIEYFQSLGAGTSRAVGKPPTVIADGKRHDTLMRHACSLRTKGHSESEIEAILLVMNRERCQPPLEETEVAELARDVSTRYETAERIGADDGGTIQLDVLTARALCELPDPPATDELLGTLVVRGQRVVLGGHTGEGKTTMSLQIIRAILAGDDFLEWKGRGDCKALFIDAEQGLRSIKRRLREAGLHDHDQLDYVRVPDGLKLDTNQAHIDAVAGLLERGDYALVVLDPLYKLHGGDSNEERSAVDLMRTLDGWREQHHFSLLLPAHCRKPQLGSTALTIHDLFGSTAYLRGAEVVLAIQRRSDGAAKLHYLKDRDGDLPVGKPTGLLFDRGLGYRIDPNDGKPKPQEVALEMLARDPEATDEAIMEATGVTTTRAVQKYRKAFREASGDQLFEDSK